MAMNRGKAIEAFVLSLAETKIRPHLRNPYRHPDASHNLRVFLTARERLARTALLVGEAPGYKGAAVSGVPFTSLSILTEHWADPWDSFGPDAGYRVPEQARFRREATATIIWQCLSETLPGQPLPLTWNAVPFHPTGATPDSNASLARGEIPLGRPWLERLLELFPNVVPAAVGLRACDALNALDIKHWCLRHPSRGGKAQFAKGLRGLSQYLRWPAAPHTLRCSRQSANPQACDSRVGGEIFQEHAAS